MSISGVPISPRAQTRLKRREGGIEPTIKANHASNACFRDGVSAFPSALDIEVDRLFTKYRFASRRGPEDEICMSVRTGRDDYCANRWITYCSLGIGSFRSVLTGKFSRRGRKDVYYILERDARLSSQIACMNLANAASSEDRYIRHLILYLFIWL
jgi:hypothetical protein